MLYVYLCISAFLLYYLIFYSFLLIYDLIKVTHNSMDAAVMIDNNNDDDDNDDDAYKWSGVEWDNVCHCNQRKRERERLRNQPLFLFGWCVIAIGNLHG